MEQPYTTGTWNGLTVWRCRLCSWDTLDGEEVMLAHIAERHYPRPVSIDSGVLIYGPDGQPITQGR